MIEMDEYGRVNRKDLNNPPVINAVPLQSNRKPMRFEKVSFEQFAKDYRSIETNYHCEGEWIRDVIYNMIRLPKRATKGSAGYDIYSPFDFTLGAGETIKIPTGIRVLLGDDKFLAIYPRSGLGFKYKVQLYNGVAIIDADYSNSDNEGHIWIKLYNDSPEGKELGIRQGDAFCQGIIQQFFKVEDDDVTEERNGGFGSTG